MQSLQFLTAVTLVTLVMASFIAVVSSGINFKIPVLFFNLQKNPKQQHYQMQLQQHQKHHHSHQNHNQQQHSIRQPKPHHPRPHMPLALRIPSLLNLNIKPRPHIPSPSMHKPQTHLHSPMYNQPQAHPLPHIPQPQAQQHDDMQVFQKEQGPVYLHDPESTVNFYFKENLFGPAKRVGIHHDGCREVPSNQWNQKPKSLWAKHCITLYQDGHCHGAGVQVAGMVHELRSAGMHYGVHSYKPCEKNIRIRFEPNKHHDSHLH